jgi:hypothetical protein
MAESVATVPATTRSPARLATRRDSPVTIDPSTSAGLKRTVESDLFRADEGGVKVVDLEQQIEIEAVCAELSKL